MLEQSTHATSFAYRLLKRVDWPGNNRISTCLAVLGSMYMYMFGVTPSRAAVHLPVITAVTANYSTNEPTITIAGRYFGSITPTVTLDGVPLVITTYTQTSVTALLPANFSPGTYVLLLTNNVLQLAASFDATIGAVGPEGPAGPAGATGSAGPPGANGPSGPSGPQGATGATGLMGPAGPTGPQGPQGVAGAAGATGPQGLTWQGVWNNSATYALNDAVSYNGSTYISLVANNTNNEPDTAPAAWSLVASAGAAGPAGPAGLMGPQGGTGATGAMGPGGPTGPQGPQGVAGSAGLAGPQGLTWQGAWNISATYALNDAVSYSGSTYISVTANNTANEPDTTPAAWSLVASAGATGPAGPAGAAGSTGPQGPAGPMGPQGAMGATGATGATGPPGPAGPTNIYHTAPNSNGTPFTITTNNTFFTIATLTLPAGNYWISSKVNAANDGGADIEVVCQLAGGPLTGTYSQVDLLPDNGTVGIFLATLPLEAAVTLTSTTAVSLQCEAAPAPVTLFLYYPQMTAIPVTNITNQ